MLAEGEQCARRRNGDPAHVPRPPALPRHRGIVAPSSAQQGPQWDLEPRHRQVPRRCSQPLSQATTGKRWRRPARAAARCARPGPWVIACIIKVVGSGKGARPALDFASPGSSVFASVGGIFLKEFLAHVGPGQPQLWHSEKRFYRLAAYEKPGSLDIADRLVIEPGQA